MAYNIEIFLSIRHFQGIMGEGYLAKLAGFRHDSPNLVICGLDSELPAIERELESKGILVRLLPTQTEYHELPKPISVPHNTLMVDVVRIADPFGQKALGLRGRIAQLIEAYDAVFGVYYVPPPDAGGLFPDVVLIKRFGVIETGFDTPPLQHATADELI